LTASTGSFLHYCKPPGVLFHYCKPPSLNRLKFRQKQEEEKTRPKCPKTVQNTPIFFSKIHQIPPPPKKKEKNILKWPKRTHNAQNGHFDGFTSLQLRFSSVNFSLTSLQLSFGLKKATSLIPVFHGLGSSEYGYCCFLWPGYGISLQN